MVSKGKKDMSKYKVGDKVRVVDNSSGHEFYFEDIVVLTVKSDGDDTPQWLACRLDDSSYWYVSESDIEPYVEPVNVVDDKYTSYDTLDNVKEGPSISGTIENLNTPSYNNVSKPAHYNHGEGIECIDYIKQVLGKEGFVAYCRGNQMKYQHRAFYKGSPVEDMEKAHQYQAWAIETLKEIHK